MVESTVQNGKTVHEREIGSAEALEESVRRGVIFSGKMYCLYVAGTVFTYC